MIQIAEYQQLLVESLLHKGDSELQLHLRGQPSESQQRLNVYRNNFMYSLTQALSDAYPVIQRLLGAHFFQGLARDYVLSNLPQEASLLHYGAHFADFLAQHPSCTSMPYLPDVARIECLYIDCFHGPEANTINVTDLLEFPEEDLPNARFTAHPNAFLFHSTFAALDIWLENLKTEVETIDLDSASNTRLLLFRQELEVIPMQLEPVCFQFCSALFEGQSIAEAWQHCLSDTPDLEQSELYNLLNFLLQLPIFSKICVS